MSGARPSTVVVARRVGRLANRIVLFAHLVAAAAEHGFVVLNPAFHTYARFFPATAGRNVPRYPARRGLPQLPRVPRLVCTAAEAWADGLHRLQAHGRDVGLIRLPRDHRLDLNSPAFLDALHRHRVVFLQDWFFRNEENCVRHRDLVRDFFTPRDEHLAHGRAVADVARRRDRMLVGVHVRRGDYSRFKGGRFLYSLDQYGELMRSVEASAARDVTFLACSDEPLPVDAFRGFDVMAGNGRSVDDLYALAACDRIVGPPSTFSTWASYYGDVPLAAVADPSAPVTDASFAVAAGLVGFFEPELPYAVGPAAARDAGATAPNCSA